MATAPDKLKIEDIDLLLRDAEVCHVQLKFLRHLLNKPGVDKRKSAEIESKCATIFRTMMSNLYSVLDQIYYFLYCHCQNKGYVSYSKAAFQMKQPIRQDLKWSEDDTRDGQPECKKTRNKWITDQCKAIFGNFNFPESKRHRVRCFQDSLLQLQAIRKVGKGGNEVLGPGDEPTLLRVVRIEHDDAEDIEHDAGGNLLQFNPSKLEVEELRPVADTPWNDTIRFNLLHFFRNFTAHRSLIACKTKEGYFNVKTRKFKPADQNSSLAEPWIFHRKGFWILVPELSHLRQVERQKSPTFSLHPLIVVCHSLLHFVKIQRRNLLLVLNNTEDYPYRYVVKGFGNGFVKIRKGKFTGKCRWEVAHLWPVMCDIA